MADTEQHSVPARVAPTAPVVSDASQAGNLAPGNSAAVTVPRFGGLRGGKPRKDGLVPGSPEAAAADRERDKLRKAAERKSVRAPDPAALPSVAGAVASPVPTPASGAVAQPGASPVSFVPWDAATLKPLFDQLIPTIEDLQVDHLVERVTSMAKKAQLSPEVVSELGKDISKDARWPGTSRKAIEITAPQVAAKWMNKSGISAEHQPEVVLGTAIVSIVVSQRKLTAKLQKLLAAAEQQKPVNTPKP